MKKEDIGPQELLHEELKEANEMPLKDGWSEVCEENKVSFIRLESWSFRNQRGFVEVRIEKTLTDLAYFIISHGCEYHLAKLMDIQALAKHPFRERVNLILNFIDCRNHAEVLTLIIRCLLPPTFPMSLGNIGTVRVSSLRSFLKGAPSFNVWMIYVVSTAAKLKF